MLVEREKGHPVILTDAQIEQLPYVLRVIVEHARHIENMCCATVVSFEDFKKQRNIMRDYVRDAARIFMPLSVKDGPLATV